MPEHRDRRAAQRRHEREQLEPDVGERPQQIGRLLVVDPQPVGVSGHSAGSGAGFAAGTIDVSVSCAQRSLKPAKNPRTSSASRRWSVLSPASTGRWSSPPVKANEITIANAPPISGRSPPRKHGYPPTSVASSNLPLLMRCTTLTTAPTAPAISAATGVAHESVR